MWTGPTRLFGGDERFRARQFRVGAALRDMAALARSLAAGSMLIDAIR